MTLKEFFESKQLLAINLKTKEQSIIFSKQADKLGKKWNSGTSCVDYNYWDKHKETTCYDNQGRFSNIFYYNSLDECKVLSFEDIEWEELKMSDFTKKDIKNGAIIELRNGKRFLKVDNTLFEIKNNELVECYDSYLPLIMFEENLTYFMANEYDIVKVLNPSKNNSNPEGCYSSLILLRSSADIIWTWERKEKRKIKLKELNDMEYEKWLHKNCDPTDCKNCVFNKVNCSNNYYGWISNKDLYSNKFLNQEIELEE